MTPKKKLPATMPPTLSPSQAIPLLRRQFERADAIETSNFNDPRVEVWAIPRKTSWIRLLGNLTENGTGTLALSRRRTVAYLYTSTWRMLKFSEITCSRRGREKLCWKGS